MKILEQIRFEMDNLGELQEPTEKLREGENIIGTCSDDEKKLWTLYCHYKTIAQDNIIKSMSEKVQESIRKALESPTPGGLSIGMLEISPDGAQHELIAKHHLLREIFWYTVRSEHNAWDAGLIGVRAGWGIVISTGKEE